MTREEQINIRKEEYAENVYSDDLCKESLELAFVEGVKWADEHPDWHTGEDLPSEDSQCWCRLKNGCYEVLRFCPYYQNWDDVEGDDFAYHKEDVIAWMELPKFNPDYMSMV